MDEIMQKDIQTLKERRTRRNSSLGNHFAKASPALVRNPFGKASLCAFLKNLSTKLKKASLSVEAAMVLPLFFLTSLFYFPPGSCVLFSPDPIQLTTVLFLL